MFLITIKFYKVLIVQLIVLTFTSAIAVQQRENYLSSRTYSRHIWAWLLNPACSMPDHSSRAFDMLPQYFAWQSKTNN